MVWKFVRKLIESFPWYSFLPLYSNMMSSYQKGRKYDIVPIPIRNINNDVRHQDHCSKRIYLINLICLDSITINLDIDFKIINLHPKGIW